MKDARITSELLATKLGYANRQGLEKLAAAHDKFLKKFGGVSTMDIPCMAGARGMSTTEVKLYNRRQVLYLIGKSEKDVAGTPERPLFCAADVCKAVGHTDSASAVARHVEPEDVEPIRRNVGSSQTRADYVNERGLYSLLLGVRRLPKAEPFRLWVTGEVLPSIRKTGSYATEARP